MKRGYTVKNIGTVSLNKYSRNKQKAEGKLRLANWLPDVFTKLGAWQQNHWQMRPSVDNCLMSNCYWRGSGGDLEAQWFRERGSEPGETELKLEQVGRKLKAKIMSLMALVQTSSSKKTKMTIMSERFIQSRISESPSPFPWKRQNVKPVHFTQEPG